MYGRDGRVVSIEAVMLEKFIEKPYLQFNLYVLSDLHNVSQ